MKRIVFLAFWALATICFPIICQADDGDKLVALKKIEGVWTITHETEQLGTATKKCEFKLENNVLVVKINQSDETVIPLEEISYTGGELKMSFKLPPFIRPAEIKVNSEGKISGQTVRGGSRPGFVEIKFNK